MISCSFAYSVFLWWTCFFILSAILCKPYIDFLSRSTSKFSIRGALIWGLTWVSLIAITECWLDTSIIDNSMLCYTPAWVTSNMIFPMIGACSLTVTFSLDMSGMIGFGIALLVISFLIDTHCWTFWFAIGSAINTDDKTIFAWKLGILRTRALWMTAMIIRVLARICWIHVIFQNFFLIITHDQFRIFFMPRCVQKWPRAWFLPWWVPVLAIFAQAFDISLLSSFLEKVTVHNQLVSVIATEELCDGKIFGENGLSFGVDISSMRSQTRTSDAWRELGGGPFVVGLAFDSPTTLRSVTLRTYCGTICTCTRNISPILGSWWFFSTIMPLLVWSFRGFNVKITWKFKLYGFKFLKTFLILGSDKTTSSPAKYASCTSHSFRWNAAFSAVIDPARKIESFIFSVLTKIDVLTELQKIELFITQIVWSNDVDHQRVAKRILDLTSSRDDCVNPPFSVSLFYFWSIVYESLVK